MKVSNFFKYISVFLLLYFFGIEGVQAQQNKLISAKMKFSFACVSATNNGKIPNPNNPNDPYGFKVKVHWSPPFPNADNKYIFELSDANGNFDNPVVLPYETNGIPKGKTENNVQTFDAFLTFPKNLNGKKYRIRVRTTNPVSQLIATIDNSPKQEFEAHYMNVDQALRTTPSGNVNLCPGQSLEISVAQIFTSVGSTNISDYTYVWYKKTPGSAGLGNPIPNQTGPKLTVTEEGGYTVAIDYGGGCLGENKSKSNTITVKVAGGGQSLVLSSSATEICSSESFTLTATPASNETYTWYRDNTKLGETNGVATYVVSPPNNLPGKYRVQIGNGSACDVRSNEIDIKMLLKLILLPRVAMYCYPTNSVPSA